MVVRLQTLDLYIILVSISYYPGSYRFPHTISNA